MPSHSDPRPLSLATIFERVDPAREALVHGDNRWTFADLDRRSAELAVWLETRGTKPDGLVAFSLPNGPDFLALAFAIYRCGATPAPLSPKLPPAEREAILAVMQPCCHILEAELPQPALVPAQSPSVHVAASWKACTSGGSTGRPKVIVDKRPAAFPGGMDFIGIPAESRVLIPGPLCHNAPFSAALFALWKGNTVITMPRFDALGALSLIAREQVEWALMVPTMMHRIMALPPTERARYDLAQWHTVVHTAAPIPPWLKQAWIDWLGADHIWEVYGATEGLVRCWIGGREWLERPGSVGRPLGGARLRVLDEAGADATPGTTGEIFAMPPEGPGSTYRYIGADRRATRDGWESVGDMGWVDADGYLFLADRKDDLIISGGVNIWPAEVEAAILRHHAVRSCAVFGRPDADLGSIVHALIETDTRFEPATLSTFLDAYLVRAKHPRSLEITQSPVRDDAGKIRKPRTAAKEHT
jgi:bile acid-coenzyme A ligase